MARNLRSVDLVLTTGCNLSCSYCYENARRPARRMPWSTVRAAIDLLLRGDRRETTLGFYGGEPLLELKTIRRAVSYVEKRRDRSGGPRYAIVTNGMLLDAEASAFLARHRFRTQLSFDGVPAAQAERGAGTFAVLDALLDRLRRDHLGFFEEQLHVMATLTPSHVEHLADSVDYFLDKGVRRIRLSPEVGDTSDWSPRKIDQLDRQFALVFESSLRHYELTGEIPLAVLGEMSPESCPEPCARTLCGAPGGEALAVDVDGEVHGCATFARSFQTFHSTFLQRQLEPLRVGNLHDPDFDRRLAGFPRRATSSAIFRRHERKRSSYGRCRDCRHLSACDICAPAIGCIPGNEDPDRVPDFICAYNLVLQTYREQFPAQPDEFDLVTGRAPLPRLLRELSELADSMNA